MRNTPYKFLGISERMLWVAAGLLIVCGAGGLIFKDAIHSGGTPIAGLLEIGTLQREGVDVKRKFFGDGIFQDIKTGDKLYQRDTIFVGPNSKAKFYLPQYGNFELDPNAVVLVVLDFERPIAKATSTLAQGPEITEAPKLRIKLLQGKLKFEKIKLDPQREVASNASAPSQGDPRHPSPPAAEVTVEVTGNTRIQLDNQETATIEKKREGQFKVMESTAPMKAQIITSDTVQPPELIDIPVQVAFKREESAASKETKIVETSEWPDAVEDLLVTPPDVLPGVELVKQEKEEAPRAATAPIFSLLPKQNVVVAEKPLLSREPAQEVSSAPAPLQATPVDVAIAAPVAAPTPQPAPSSEPEEVLTPEQLAERKVRRAADIDPIWHSLKSFEISFGGSNHQFQVLDPSDASPEKVSSQVSLGGHVAYFHNLSKSSQLKAKLEYTRVKYSDIDARALNNATHGYLGYSLGYRHSFGSNSLLGEFGIREAPMLVASGASDLAIDVFSASYLGLGFGRRFALSSTYRFEITVVARGYLPVERPLYKKEMGYGIEPRLQIEEITQADDIYTLALWMRLDQRNSSVGDSKHLGVGLELGVKWGKP